MTDEPILRKKAKIKTKTLLAPDIYRITFETDICRGAKPGQFVLVYPKDGSKLLGRPFCIADTTAEYMDIVFRVVGEGTREISSCTAGDMLEIEGPLGRGYPFDNDKISGRTIALLGGGLGAPSLLFLARELAAAGSAAETAAYLGYRDKGFRCFLADDFRAYCMDTVIATDDGSEGIHGNVLEALEESGKNPELIYACGPLPMLKAVKEYAQKRGSEAYISLEEHMACGLGVCLGCVVKTVLRDEHSRVNNARICTEGPVFSAEEVDI